jgi:glycosyltransferase involved in cell wall biosynthesis
VIVVVDGDDPVTVACIGSLNDARVRVISHPNQQGAGRARDTGADASSGKWVAFLDDDDEWAPEKLALQLGAAQTDREVVMTLSHVVSSNATYIEPADPYKNEQPIDEWLFDRRTWTKSGQSFIQTSSLMMPRAVFDTLHFRDTNQHEEWELVIRALKELKYTLTTVQVPLVTYYVPENRPALSKTATWQGSLGWIDSLGPSLITRKAYSGFCLTVVGRAAANQRDYNAFLPLLRAAFRNGRPTGRQLVAYLSHWAIPVRVRKNLRARLSKAL